MKKKIQKFLSEIEKELDVKILLAVESGSRAWGFPSKDSDYDVRFIYLHKPEWYLSVLPERDVIEIKQDKILDLSGWDLKKSLFLFRKLNPPLMEWLDSEIIYQEFSKVPGILRELKRNSFSPRLSIYHYLHMAEGNYRDYLQHEEVWLKKYFYVLRPLLACMWIEQNKSHPPIQFRKLLDFCSENYPKICDEVEILLKRKIAGDELDLGPRIDALSNFVEERKQYYGEYAKTADTFKLLETRILNEIFRNALVEVFGDRF
jgi:uncharacterized protein